MSFAPLRPRIRMTPELIAPDTWLVRQVQEGLGEPMFVYLNSMVINGAEPIIVDTGTIANRDQWMADVFSIVEPADVRWIYLSHDDIDHTGNLAEALEVCPNAELVCSWAMVMRHSNAFDFPLERCRWLNDGETFDAGDRRLRVVMPPVWDSPTSKGLFDELTGVYWAVDAFATPMPGEPVASSADLDDEFWPVGMAMFAHHALAPWLPLADTDKYQAWCDRVESLGMSAIASAHAPLITGPRIGEAFRITRQLPSIVPPPSPGQSDLDAIIAATAIPA